MNCLGTNHEAKKIARSSAFLAAVVMSAMLLTSGQTLQKGIHVELAPAHSAVAAPDADKQDASIITVTKSGQLFFGTDAVSSESLAEKLRGHAQTIYIKADARAPYESVVKALDGAHTAGIATVTFLTTPTEVKQAGTLVSPKGIEMQLSYRSAK